MQAGLGGWGDGSSKAEVGAIGNLSREGRPGREGDFCASLWHSDSCSFSYSPASMPAPGRLQ